MEYENVVVHKSLDNGRKTEVPRAMIARRR
jgi:hypothetical protein